MNISAPFIARPIATWLLAAAILLSGALGYRALPVSALPEVDFPTIQVVTQLPGASPETTETLLTASLERQFGQIPGLLLMTSQSAEGTSQITLQFTLNRSMDSAAQDVQAAINAAAGTLPPNLPYPPTYSKVNPADAPILTLALTSEGLPTDTISDAADTILQPKLSEIDGVGRVTVQGGLRPAVRVRVDPARLAAYGLAMEDVRTAVANANVNGAKGGFDGPRLAFALGANDQLIDAAAYQNLVIAWRNGAPVRLSAIGSVAAGVENNRVAALYNGTPAVVLDIQRQPGANIVQTVQAIQEALPRLRRAIPSGISIAIVTDRTQTIRASVRDVQYTLIMSVLLVVGVIFVFLRSARATFIPAVALPLSLVGTFGIMQLLGFGLDNLSLMALTVATGFVVDDAIVMIENIVRFIEGRTTSGEAPRPPNGAIDARWPASGAIDAPRPPSGAIDAPWPASGAIDAPWPASGAIDAPRPARDAIDASQPPIADVSWPGSARPPTSSAPDTGSMHVHIDPDRRQSPNTITPPPNGLPPLEAAFAGAVQIGFTIVSLTVSLIAVFIPLLFMTGVVGRLFKEFSVTLAVSVIVSAIISLTLTPMMCGRLLRSTYNHKPGPIARTTERAFDTMLAGYRRTLDWSFRHPSFVLTMGALTLAGTIGLYVVIPKGFLPRQDTGVILAITEAAQSASIPKLVALQTRMAEIIRQDPAVTGVVAFAGAGTINVTPNTGRLTIALKPVGQRPKMDIVIARMEEAIAGIPGITAFFQPVQDIQIGTRVSRTQFQYTLIDTDAAELATWAPRLRARLATLAELKNVASDQQDQGFRTFINVDRDAAMRLGVSMQAIQDTLYDGFGQRQISTIFGQANQYRVVLEADPLWQADPNSLRLLRVPGANDVQVPLSAIARIEKVTAPLVITHQEQFPSVTLSFDLAQGFSLGHAVAAVAQAEKDIAMPETITGSYAGDAAEFQTSLSAEPWLILAAVVVIYIVLGVLYESWVHPITILSTLPSAGIGALLALMICGIDLSLVALVGIVLLMGIVKKNAIMMVDFAIEAERTRNLSPHDAMREACLLRFRPIMMTTMAALLGALPLVLERGAGSELRYPLGVTIIGGLLLSQFLTLYTTPAIYLAFERLRSRVSGPRSLETAAAK